jgi:hypothetical protein
LITRRRFISGPLKIIRAGHSVGGWGRIRCVKSALTCWIPPPGEHEQVQQSLPTGIDDQRQGRR